MSEDDLAQLEKRLIGAAVARLRASVMAVTFGLAGGVSLFTATAWLLVRGGVMVGLHLELLNHYLPGYRVTWPGAFIGFFYGAVIGAVAGWLVAWVYNRVAALRNGF